MHRNIIFFWFVISSALQAQNRTLDSLKLLLRNHPTKDTTQVRLLIQMADNYQNYDPQLGIQTAQTALTLSDKLKHTQGLILAYSSLGMNYVMNSQNPQAIKAYKKGIALLKNAHDNYQLAVAYHNLAYVYSIQGQNKKAIQIETIAYQITNKLGKKKGSITALNAIGTNYFYLSDYKKAADFYFKALHLAELIKNQKLIALCFENIALVYKKIENKNKAYEYYQKALLLYKKIDYPPGLLNLYTNFGAAKDQFSDPMGALELYKQGIDLAQKVHNPRAEYGLLCNLGILMFDQKQYENALGYFKKCMDFYRATSDLKDESILSQYYAETLINVSDAVLIQEGIRPAQRFYVAIDYLKKALKYALEIESVDQQIAARELLAKLYQQNKDFQSALNEHLILVKVKDSLAKIQSKETMLKQEHDYQLDKNQALAKAAIQRQKVVRYAVIIFFGILVLLGFLFFIEYRKRQKNQQQQNELLLKAQISEVELKALRLQMNPHFIFNCLNSISDYIQKNDTEKADYYLVKFAKLMRGILENSEEKEISIAQEIKVLELYMQLEAARLPGMFTFEFKIDGKIDIESTLIPPMILQPFVENSIWHGLNNKNGNGKIIIEFKQMQDLLQLSVQDDGVGRILTTNRNRKSFGVKITQDRLDIIKKLKSAHAKLNIIDLEEGTRVEIQLPLEIE